MHERFVSTSFEKVPVGRRFGGRPEGSGRWQCIPNLGDKRTLAGAGMNRSTLAHASRGSDTV